MKVILLCLLAAVALAHESAHAAPLNLQVCAVNPTTGGIAGCPNASVSFAAVSPTSLVRSQVLGSQGWRAYGSLVPSDTVYASDGQWHILSTITPALVATAPIPDTCPNTFVPVNWTCTAANGVATCTAPLK